jgi:redox-sensitive bicupin YhaK (pirin superfamily)
MSLTVRPGSSRGKEAIDWLDSRHSFSFGHYYDPAHMGFRTLRVINEDVVRGGAGFPTHGHRDMEIITYMVRGAIAHRDSTGAAGVLRRGDVQAMTAGTGVRHSEINPEAGEDARFLQIWVLPERAGLKPAYRQAHFADAEKRNTLRPLILPEGGEGILSVHQDVRLFASLLDPGARVSYEPAAGRGVWIQVVDGHIRVADTDLGAGDGAALTDAGPIEMVAREAAEFLLFDLG